MVVFEKWTDIRFLHLNLGESYPRTSLPTKMGVGGRQRRVRETGTHTGWCPPAFPTRLSRRELALARFARFGLLGSPTDAQ